jgi:hypothetical protein
VTSRVLIWTFAGVVVAGFWALYAVLTFPTALSSAPPIVWTLINVTCPVAFASFHFHFGIKLYWVLLANAASYALFGLAMERLRQQFSHAR